ncbi:TPA: head maturation protease, ClpP-related [Acinetobacter baumannii]|uniref:head maturation protease, ClpP-related n=1 Tax=Acinetobacter baumannii TaxID=470 RepID=UPI003182F366
MSRREQMPTAPDYSLRGKLSNKFSPDVLNRWNQSLKAADDNADNTIGIYDPIGYDYWTDSGVTAKRISAALRSMGSETDVVVNINSPGGDVFEGLAIYNLLRAHKGKVTVRVIGLAASAASFIAMAADEIQIARAGFFMIHNAWTVTWGNRHDLLDTAELLGQIDETIADIYHIRTGLDATELGKMMDAESWINGKNSVENGFADSLLDSDVLLENTDENSPSNEAAKKIDMLLAQIGVSRTDRRSLIKDLKTGTHNAIHKGTHNATDNEELSTSDLLELQKMARQLNESV